MTPTAARATIVGMPWFLWLPVAAFGWLAFAMLVGVALARILKAAA